MKQSAHFQWFPIAVFYVAIIFIIVVSLRAIESGNLIAGIIAGIVLLALAWFLVGLSFK